MECVTEITCLVLAMAGFAAAIATGLWLVEKITLAFRGYLIRTRRYWETTND